MFQTIRCNLTEGKVPSAKRSTTSWLHIWLLQVRWRRPPSATCESVIDLLDFFTAVAVLLSHANVRSHWCLTTVFTKKCCVCKLWNRSLAAGWVPNWVANKSSNFTKWVTSESLVSHQFIYWMPYWLLCAVERDVWDTKNISQLTKLKSLMPVRSQFIASIWFLLLWNRTCTISKTHWLYLLNIHRKAINGDRN